MKFKRSLMHRLSPSHSLTPRRKWSPKCMRWNTAHAPVVPPHAIEPARLARWKKARHEPIIIRSAAETIELGLDVVPDTERPQSKMIATMVVGEEFRGTISLENLDREDAFSEGDARLLQTLTSSLGVALENARLFDAEKQRAAELEIINRCAGRAGVQAQFSSHHGFGGRQTPRDF